MNFAADKQLNRELQRNFSSAAPVAQIVALNELPIAAAVEDMPALLQDTNPFHGIKTQVQVCVGQATVTVGQLLAAREQEVLVLDRTPEQPVDLLLEGKVIARGHLVAVDGRFAIRIVELPTALTLPQRP